MIWNNSWAMRMLESGWLFLLPVRGAYVCFCRGPRIARGMMNSVMIQSEVKCIKTAAVRMRLGVQKLRAQI